MLYKWWYCVFGDPGWSLTLYCQVRARYACCHISVISDSFECWDILVTSNYSRYASTDPSTCFTFPPGPISTHQSRDRPLWLRVWTIWSLCHSHWQSSHSDSRRPLTLCCPPPPHTHRHLMGSGSRSCSNNKGSASKGIKSRERAKRRRKVDSVDPRPWCWKKINADIRFPQWQDNMMDAVSLRDIQ